MKFKEILFLNEGKYITPTTELSKGTKVSVGNKIGTVVKAI